MANISVYESIARNLGDLMIKGTPTNATATAFESNALIHPLTDQLKGREVYFFTGGGAGQARTITAFTPGSNHAVVDPQFSTVPSSNSQFLMFSHWVGEDYENAMNRAMGKTKLIHLNESVATLALVATQYEYLVPSGFEYISNLNLVPSGNTDYGNDDEVNRIFELPPRYWNVLPNAKGSYVIAFDPRKINLDTVKDKWINVVGQTKPDFAGTIISEELQEYIINHASMLLASQRIGENKEWSEKFRLFKDIVKDLEIYIHSNKYGRRVGG